MSHGRKNLELVAPHSKMYKGKFGRLFRTLPAWSPRGVPQGEERKFFLEFANKNMIELKDGNGKPLGPSDIANDRDIIEKLEKEFDSNIPAGYTYFGQFVDHDITFDPTPLGGRDSDPNGLVNHRTPRLDLDSVYGGGPDVSPYLYEFDAGNTFTGKFLIDKVQSKVDRDTQNNRQSKEVTYSDLPRNNRGREGSDFVNRALIGDVRNDENSIVTQVHLAFLLAHNNLVDKALIKLKAEKVDVRKQSKIAFGQARNTLQWLYQYIVWNDYLSRITDKKIRKNALIIKTDTGRNIVELGYKDVYRWKEQPFIPVEFSVAAYRFGHSMVRNSYRTNSDVHESADVFIPIFNNVAQSTGNNLRGFRKLSALNIIQWDWFLDMESSKGQFPQRARNIDTKLSNALSFLHEEMTGDPLNILAARNLERGHKLGLPSGTDVAKTLGYKPLSLKPDDYDGQAIHIKYKENSLWFYILKEADERNKKAMRRLEDLEALEGSQSLNGKTQKELDEMRMESKEGIGPVMGQVGSTIICATFAGLLKGDPNSFVNMCPDWEPEDDELLKNHTVELTQDAISEDNKWTVASIIRLSGLPIKGGDIRFQPS